MRTERIVFDVVKYKAIKYVKIDGKRRRRQKTFWQTVNFFNQMPDGRPKTYDQIYQELRLEAETWKKE